LFDVEEDGGDAGRCGVGRHFEFFGGGLGPLLARGGQRRGEQSEANGGAERAVHDEPFCTGGMCLGCKASAARAQGKFAGRACKLE
jgi:hypothetical protein